MTIYYRPMVQSGPARTGDAVTLAGGWTWFDHVECLTRDGPPDIAPVAQIPDDVRARLTMTRAPLAGLEMDQPRLMGILNVTPDSFSDGGLFLKSDAAGKQAQAMLAAGADIVDIGGESTRPGADFVPAEEEIARVVPVIEALRGITQVPISIDTRKGSVASGAVQAGATIINDVSALSFDSQLVEIASENGIPVCLMHAQGDPKTMQAAPSYDDVLLDVYDYLERRVTAAEDAGIPRTRIIVDPGIGFGKTLDHNLALLRRISLFHALGCVVLLGASRKRFIGTIANVDNAAARMPGSLAVALSAVAQGVQIIRVHDMAETRQAMSLWAAVSETGQ